MYYNLAYACGHIQYRILNFSWIWFWEINYSHRYSFWENDKLESEPNNVEYIANVDNIIDLKYIISLPKTTKPHVNCSYMYMLICIDSEQYCMSKASMIGILPFDFYFLLTQICVTSSSTCSCILPLCCEE